MGPGWDLGTVTEFLSASGFHIWSMKTVGEGRKWSRCSCSGLLELVSCSEPGSHPALPAAALVLHIMDFQVLWQGGRLWTDGNACWLQQDAD